MSRSSAISGGAPLVSVLMPVRGCRDTLPMAVGSMLAQTLEDWELLLVHDDDGAGLEWLTRLGGGRIRVLPAHAPGGRGAARQAGLEAARGEFLAFLDADDWMLPERLARQVEVLDADPELALVSAGMFVLDKADQPVGVRRVPGCASTVQSAAPDIVDSPVLSASSMIRGEIARRTSYDTDFASGEDADFLVRCLQGRRYLQQRKPLYCYREYASFSMRGLRLGLAAERRRRLKHAASAPEQVMCWSRWAAKRVLYEIAVAARGKEYVLRRRCRRPTPEELADWSSAASQVEEQLNQLRR